MLIFSIPFTHANTLIGHFSSQQSRIPLPFTLEEYQRGQLYMIAKASREETNGSEGIEVLVNERFKTETGEGIYTHKVIHLSKRLPSWTRKVLGLDSVLQIEEKSWNMFPYSKTIYKSSLFGDRCVVVVDTRHISDSGTTDDALFLTSEQLRARTVETLDIAQDSNDHSDEKLADPRSFTSTKRNRGPLAADWIDSTKPMICAYKYVHIDFQYRAFRSKIEHTILDVMKSIYLRTHRQAYVWMDEWVDLTDADLRKLEDEIHVHLNSTLKKRNEASLSSLVPPMPGALPRPRSGESAEQASSSQERKEAAKHPPTEEEKASIEYMAPPKRRLRTKLKSMGHKLMAKL